MNWSLMDDVVDPISMPLANNWLDVARHTMWGMGLMDSITNAMYDQGNEDRENRNRSRARGRVPGLQRRDTGPV